MSACFHCGLPAGHGIHADIDGAERSFCCVACRSVAQAIASGGLANFYHYRDSKNKKPDFSPTNLSIYDQDDVQQSFVRSLSAVDEDAVTEKNLNDLKEAFVSLNGISCAACAWLIEKHLLAIAGISEIHVNATNHRARIVWRQSQLPLSKIFAAIETIGYQATPYVASEEQAQRQKESRLALMRIGVAGIGMMQVGMFAIALHAGAIQDMDASWRYFFRWVSLLVATPVVFFSARPFFTNAKRALKQKQLNMDVPVALAIGLAFIASAYATVMNTGEVYFDSVSMFTFFLLVGRYLELRVRHSSAFMLEKMSRILPLTVERISAQQSELIPLLSLAVGDHLRVHAGEVVPCDGVVLRGEGSVEESMLTGEVNPVLKRMGDPVYAGTINAETSLLIECRALGNDTQLAAVEALFERALTQRPKLVSRADAWARKFVFGILLISLLVAVAWFFIDPERMLWVVLSVLVATCPCALSLATPAALTAGTLAMRRMGLIVMAPNFIEQLPAIDYCVMDKTGTLTDGKISLKKVICLSDMNEQQVLGIIAALESGSRHPIARAFAHIPVDNTTVSELKTIVGKGVQGCISTAHYKFGLKNFALPEAELDYPSTGLWQLLSCDNKALAWVLLDDHDRSDVAQALDYFSQRNIQCMLLSGDRQDNVAAFAERYSLPWLAQQLPHDKLAYIQALQQQGHKVMMLGDGINDVPVLGGADSSIAMGDASRLAQTHADAVLLNNSVSTLPHIFSLGKNVQRKIKQNLLWAIGYNLSVLPLAASGLLPPYLAALGMSLSSLIVVVNAVGLHQRRDVGSAQTGAPLKTNAISSGVLHG